MPKGTGPGSSRPPPRGRRVGRSEIGSRILPKTVASPAAPVRVRVRVRVTVKVRVRA